MSRVSVRTKTVSVSLCSAVATLSKTFYALLLSSQQMVGYEEEFQYMDSKPLSSILNVDKYQGCMHYGCQYVCLLGMPYSWCMRVSCVSISTKVVYIMGVNMLYISWVSIKCMFVRNAILIRYACVSMITMVIHIMRVNKIYVS